MPWKVGGNFETVAVTCETSWKECVIAVANYLWSEVVSDVVDYLAKEGIIWDLELKINVLTYKMQYGTWPLPHQICNLNPKFRKIRMTLSNPGDRNNWLKHVLLNPSSESNVYAPYLKPPRSSVAKLTNCLDVKQECAPHVKHSELSTACSSIETLKSTSDQSVNTYTWRPRTYPQNKSTKEKVSRSKDFTLQRRNVQLLSLNSNAINRQSSKTTPPLTQNSAHATNVKYNPCQKFTETVYECKSFLKELQRKDKRSRSLNRSSEMSKASTLKAAHAAQRSALSTTEERKTSRGASAAAKREEINETKFVERIKDNAVEGTTEETYRENKVNHLSNDAVALKTTTHPAPPRELVPIIPIMRPARNMQPSQETLVEVRRTLQGLHDVLQTYQDTTRSPEGRESTDRQIDEADSFITYPIVDISSKYLELKESLSSLAEYSSHTSKMYRCSNENVALRNTCKGISRHDIRRSVRGNPPAKPHLRSCSAMSQTSGNEREECEKDIFDCGRDHVLESSPEANKDAMKTDTPFSARDNISEADRIVYILSPESKDTQDRASLERLATGKFSNTFDEEQYRENVTISQNSSQSKMSIDSNNRQERSTALLLQEALHFKNALLTHSRRKYSIDKQGDTADESSLVSSNNFPSMIIDIKEDEPAVSNSRGKIDRRYICLEMKQRRDLFSQPLKKVNALTRREDECDTEYQDCIPETSSEYFSITDLAFHNDAAIENSVSLETPIYEKVISITIPVSAKSQDEINANERSTRTKAVLQNYRARVRENLREDAASDISGDVAGKRSLTVLKLEDLILERVKNIRDYMDTFLHSQNTAIFKARKALRCQGRSDTFRRSDEASHVVMHNRSLAPSSCSSADRIIGSSKKSSDLLANRWSSYVDEYKQETDDVLRCSSDVYLKRNPGMFALITPIENKFSNKNDTRRSDVSIGREEALSLPRALTYSCESDSKATDKISNTIARPRRDERVASNTENGKTDKGTVVDITADFHKRSKQTQITESKPSVMSRFLLDVANVNAKVIHAAREEYPTKSSNCNSISHSNSYFTDEEIISDVKMDNVSSESTSNVNHSHGKLNVQKEIKHDVIKEQLFVLGESECDYSTSAKTSPKKENDFIFDSAASLLPIPLRKENKALNTDSILSNNLKGNDEISVNIAHFSPQVERYTTKPFQTHSQIKAKSDMSLVTNRRRDLKKVNIYPKKSHSFLMRHNTRDYISGMLHQPYAKLHNDKGKCVKNKLRLTTQSKSIISSRKASTKSCIPISKNRLESPHRMKYQAQERNPLTMLWDEKICAKDHATDEVARSDSVSMSKHLRVERTVSNLTKLNIEKGTLDKESESAICRNSNVPRKNSAVLSSDQTVESLAIEKEHSDKRDLCSRKSDASILQHIEKIASKEVVVISIMANDSLRKKYPADLFILNTRNISPTTDLLIHKNKLWTITVEKTEKEVTAKPSITDTCTSMSELQ